jgi:hypothetical protein
MPAYATVEVQDSSRLEPFGTEILQKKVNFIACNRNAFF